MEGNFQFFVNCAGKSVYIHMGDFHYFSATNIAKYLIKWPGIGCEKNLQQVLYLEIGKHHMHSGMYTITIDADEQFYSEQLLLTQFKSTARDIAVFHIRFWAIMYVFARTLNGKNCAFHPMTNILCSPILLIRLHVPQAK